MVRSPSQARAVATVFVVVAGLTACTGHAGSDQQPTAAPSPTYLEAPRTVRLSETPVPSATATIIPVSFTVLGYRPRLPDLVGSHAEFLPHGEFERIRLAVLNDDATFHDIRTSAQLLLLVGGGTAKPDYQAMGITRQPDLISLGSQDRIEFDLWYDLPKGTRFDGLRVVTSTGSRDIPLPTG